MENIKMNIVKKQVIPVFPNLAIGDHKFTKRRPKGDPFLSEKETKRRPIFGKKETSINNINILGFDTIISVHGGEICCGRLKKTVNW